MLKSHYAPTIPLVIGNVMDLIEKFPGKNIRVLGFLDTYGQEGFTLSKNGDLNEAARNLFKYLRELDGMDIDLIVSEYLPDIGLGRAINDRLRRASVQA